ncbi:MAG: hypothetical protein ACD_32C00145G0010 [uncultured bacterium]|uniref:LmbE family protein n=1 Tax=Candidatus Daviesbacteria bacterium GW2011_GWC2_40_12 TaxID=1618431 RepID=A0A0G0QKZ1_9BACT|nr:MAG: hypothetical protein ACD_32C00145G0010 [uncultured bacterium]KKQ81085.1 MAG: LmbE family protein [Candidatus Daviesbacteria bacterium GW2011_GWF2_38_7]KKR24080.1 MAG: LmbE family protein [Candidatus Daviesbacteria bacterium GW2011_GWB1_39_5]KKR40778.1 MAG: LmbE family protein [Candidatus Daviesbacteria bacterium GW2011_GWC2_40_12]OGE22447.1 MAG: hypothetical protein A2778_00110 [Candidatus Daviesbacteria bacterium RIFCSPHIGHO2_01_FULL_40_24]OGE30493.1 MAG: hypothetical protein A3C29_06
MVILGVAAHPDDLDFGASGTFAKWAKEGNDCYYLICTNGSKGSDDPQMSEEKLISLRKEEQKEAAKILGLKDVFFLDHQDTELLADLTLKKEITQIIRKLKPEIVVTSDPTFVYSKERGFINHTDHRACGQATIDAVFPLARDRLTFPELASEGLLPHKVKTLYLTRSDVPTDILDITDTFDLKIKALKAHTSQINDSHIQKVEAGSRKLGKKAGFEYAEGFIILTLPG